jgi:hypothetical protein
MRSWCLSGTARRQAPTCHRRLVFLCKRFAFDKFIEYGRCETTSSEYCRNGYSLLKLIRICHCRSCQGSCRTGTGAICIQQNLAPTPRNLSNTVTKVVSGCLYGGPEATVEPSIRRGRSADRTKTGRKSEPANHARRTQNSKGMFGNFQQARTSRARDMRCDRSGNWSKVCRQKSG